MHPQSPPPPEKMHGLHHLEKLWLPLFIPTPRAHFFPSTRCLTCDAYSGWRGVGQGNRDPLWISGRRTFNRCVCAYITGRAGAAQEGSGATATCPSWHVLPPSQEEKELLPPVQLPDSLKCISGEGQTMPGILLAKESVKQTAHVSSLHGTGVRWKRAENGHWLLLHDIQYIFPLEFSPHPPPFSRVTSSFYRDKSKGHLDSYSPWPNSDYVAAFTGSPPSASPTLGWPALSPHLPFSVPSSSPLSSPICLSLDKSFHTHGFGDHQHARPGYSTWTSHSNLRNLSNTNFVILFCPSELSPSPDLPFLSLSLVGNSRVLADVPHILSITCSVWIVFHSVSSVCSLFSVSNLVSGFSLIKLEQQILSDLCDSCFLLPCPHPSPSWHSAAFSNLPSTPLSPKNASIGNQQCSPNATIYALLPDFKVLQNLDPFYLFHIYNGFYNAWFIMILPKKSPRWSVLENACSCLLCFHNCK